MSALDVVQTARKDAQLARIAAKGSPDYHLLYAKQPAQVARAIELGAKRKAERDAVSAGQAQTIENASGAVAVFAGALSTGGEG